MKFNEKLIQLRKREGLSQEELGYKLNVTRQTVSKWELGQTTPEMDKLIEMSKMFNISVDELINEESVTTNDNTVIEDQPIEEKPAKKNKLITIIVIALIIVLVWIIIKWVLAFTIFNKVSDTAGGLIDNFLGSEQNENGESKGFFERIFELFDKVLDSQEEKIDNMRQEGENKIESSNNEINKIRFNGVLELYQGSKSGVNLKRLIDEIIKTNKTEEKKVTVKYLETETQDTEEIKNLKTSFDDSKNFEISFDYDEEGYINRVTIERVISKFEVSSFNNSLELYAGTKMGGIVIYTIDTVITSNKKEERKITVKYNEIETQNEEEIKNIKLKIETFKNYNISFDYDADGFINKATIENM